MNTPSDKKSKKAYEAPKIFRVTLNHDQAILSGCSTGTTSVSNSTGTRCRTTCRRQTATTGTNSLSSS